MPAYVQWVAEENAKHPDNPTEVSISGFLSWVSGRDPHAGKNTGEQDWYTPEEDVKKWTQARLAKEFGVGQQTVSDWLSTSLDSHTGN